MDRRKPVCLVKEREALNIGVGRRVSPSEAPVGTNNVGRTLGQYTPANGQLSMSHLQAGMYLVALTSTTNQTQTVKVIKH